VLVLYAIRLRAHGSGVGLHLVGREVARIEQLISVERCEGRGEAIETAIGLLPAPGSIDVTGLNMPGAAMDTLLKVDPLEWYEAVHLQHDFLEKFGESVPAGIWHEHGNLARRVAGM
jgi:phosphoenolpyruvate carboxykinase (GTP)